MDQLKLNDIIDNLNYTPSVSSALKSILDENIQKFQSILNQLDNCAKENNDSNLNAAAHLNVSLPVDQSEYETKCCSEIMEKQNLIDQHKTVANEINANIMDYISKLKLNHEYESKLVQEMVDESDKIDRNYLKLTQLLGIRLKITMMDNSDLYQIKVFGDGFEICVTMDHNEKFELHDIVPKPDAFNEIKMLLSRTNDICGLVSNCRKFNTQ